jgi:N-formylglutamate amidohydrolase
MADPTPDEQKQPKKTDDELFEEVMADPVLGRALRLVLDSGIGPEEWCEEEEIDLEAMKAFASICQRRVEGNATLTAFGAACHALQVGVVARKFQDRAALDRLASLETAIGELRAGTLDLDDFLGLVAPES